MRIANVKFVLLGLALAGIASSLYACGPYDDDTEPTAIKFPGTIQGSTIRGDYLLCRNNANRIIAVDLKRAKTYDIGPEVDKRWQEGDVADGQALLIEVGGKNHLLAINLKDGNTAHKLDLGNDPVRAYGFAGKGKAFVHRGQSVAILELATGKTLHTIELGKDERRPRGFTAWQKVGDRLFVTGPASTLCVIDLHAGKLLDRFSLDARNGIASLQVEGSLVYCIGTPFGWGARVDHLTCLDMEMRRNFIVDLKDQVRRVGRLASGPYGTAYVFEGNRVERYTMSGDRCGSFTTPGKENVLAVWHHRALIAAKDEIRLVEIKETPVARK